MRYDSNHHEPALVTRILVRGLALLIAVLLCSPCVNAQSGSGGIQGTVQDGTGAVIAGALVHAVNQKTGVAVDTKSNDSGFYSVSSLFAGDYTLTFSAAGMKRFETSLSLQVAQTAVINPALTLGSASEQVTVSGNAVQLATYDSGTISATLDNKRLNELPVNGRFLLTLAGLTTPGLEAGGTRANGLLGEAMEYVQDGAPLLNRNFGGEASSAQAQLPDPDFVQEVRIETTNSNAQFATPATGIITSKSGTNTFHGSLFETARNNGIGIAKVRQNPSNFAAPHYVRNEFGVSLGGPVRIPHLYNGKDKTFFFFAYERYSLRSFVSELVTVPKVEWRNGDFSTLYVGGTLQTLYDPSTTDATGARTAFAGNKINPSRQSPLAKNLLAITPLPTTNDNPYVTPNLNVAGINNATIPQYNFRIDHAVNENNRLYLRYSWIDQHQVSLRNYPSNSAQTIAGAGLPDGASGLQQGLVTNISGALGYTHIFSPSFVSETNLSQQWFQQNIIAGGQPNLNYEAALGLPNNFGEAGFPTITGATMPYGGTQFNYKENQIITNLDENLTKVIGRHQLLFGGRYRHERFGYLPDRSADTVTFGAYASGLLDPKSGTNYTALANTGNGNADLFLGAAASYSVNLNSPYTHYRDMEFDSYFQDNFHVNKNLTINAGLRWEIHPAAQTADGVTSSFDIAKKALVLPMPTSFYIQKGYTTQAIINNLANLGVNIETPDAAGIPSALLYNYNFNFAPRIGFAYTPFNGRYGTVVRGGFGRFFYPVPVRNSLINTATKIPFTANYSQSYISANQSPDGQPNYLLRSNQNVIAGSNSSSVVNSATSTSIQPGVQASTLDPHYAPDVVSEVNATIEQPLKYNTVFRVTYIYNHGANLDQNFYYNSHPSTYVYEANNGVALPTGQYAATGTGPYDQTTYGNSVVSQKTGYSNNNSLQVNLQRLFRNGYAFQAFWVYSRAFRVGGNTFRDGQLYPTADYLPSVLPGSTDLTTLNHFENYQLDTAIPEHRIGFNGLVDIPVGRGKKLFGNANRFWNEVFGGFQVAGTGQVLSQWFQVAAANWGATNPIKVYKSAKPITDCRSGVCRKENLWFNGYINPKNINAASLGVSGLPTDYAPYLAPINNDPNAAAGSYAATNFGTNNVPLTLKNGSTLNVAYAAGPNGANRFSHTILPGPINYNVDLSVFKVFPITEKVNFRVNVDAFNAFNIQGYTNPNTTDGTQNFLTSYWTGRQIQLTARLTF